MAALGSSLTPPKSESLVTKAQTMKRKVRTSRLSSRMERIGRKQQSQGLSTFCCLEDLEECLDEE